MSERDRIVRWLRSPAMQNDNGWMADSLADAIEAGEHLKRPDPTIPASEWVKTPSVGH